MKSIAALLALLCAASIAQAAEPSSRSQRSSTPVPAAAQATFSAGSVATPRPSAQQSSTDRGRWGFQAQEQRTNAPAPAAPVSRGGDRSPNYQFTQVPQRSLW